MQESKLTEVLSRKEAQERDALKMKYFLLHKWDIIKAKKRLYLQELQNLNRHKAYKRLWAAVISSLQLTHSVFSKFDEQRRICYLEKQKLACIRSFRRVFRGYLKRRGQSPSFRIQK